MANGEYPRDWRARRQEVVERDRFTCQNCERKGGDRGDAELLAVHLIPLEMGGTHDTDNLLTLCRQCKHSISREQTDARDPEGTADQDVRVIGIDDLQDFRRALAHVDKIESMVSGYAAQVLGDGDIDEGRIVRKSNSFRIDARDVKQHLLTSRVMFSNVNLGTDAPEEDPFAKMTREVFSLLRLELEIVNRYLDYIGILQTTTCPRCGYDGDHDARLCGECSRELPVLWECLQCRTNIDELEEDYCTACGNELPDLPPKQRQQLESIQEATEEAMRDWRDQLQTVMDVVENDIVPVYDHG